MLRIYPRQSPDLLYFTRDHARELDGLREGAAGHWIKGAGDAHDLRDVSEVFTPHSRGAIVGYDLVFAAPRPISTLLAVDEGSAGRVIDAHRIAVIEAVSYLQRHALTVRDRRGGDDVVRPVEWDNVVAYTHGVNRHGEPHLHDHVLVGSRTSDDSRAVDARALYAHASAADALYRTSMRFHIAEKTNLTVVRTFSGAEEIVGHDDGYRALWPGRHRDRPAKVLWSREEIAAKWHHDLEGFEPIRTPEMPAHSRTHLHEHTFSAYFEGRFSISRRHVVTAWSQAAIFGARGSEVERAVDMTYPELGGRGVREDAVSLARARDVTRVRERGPRPIESDGLARWHYLSREREGRSL